MPPRNAPVNQSTIQAENRSGGGSFIEDFQKSLDEQRQLREARQREQVRVAQTTSDIAQKSATLSQNRQRDMQFLYDDVKTAQAKARDARRLADSNNILDTFELVGRQMTDPNGYIRKNREARLSEDAQQAALLQTYYATGQDALQKQLLASTSRLDVLKTIESMGMEKLTAYQDEAKLMHGQVMAVQSMKEDAISSLSDKQIAAALAEAQKTQGNVNISGVDVDARTLQDRQAQLQERTYNNLVRSTALALKQDEAAHMDETLAQKEYERALEKDDREHLNQTLAMKNAERASNMQKLTDELNRRDLASRNKAELNDLRANNYKDSVTGIQYTPGDVEAEYQRKQEIDLNRAQEEVTKFQMDNFDTNTLANEAERVDSMAKRFESSSPLYQAATKYRSALNLAVHGSGSDKGDITRLAAMNIYQSAKEQFDKAIEKQATLDASNGGRSTVDQNLKSMRIAFYRGEPVPQENLINAATDRLRNFKSIRDLFPPDVATNVERRYRELLKERLAVNPTDFTSSKPDATERKLIEAQAAQDAIQFGVNQQLQAKTDVVLPNQVQDQTHPLHSMAPGKFGGFIAQGDANGFALWAQTNQLSPEDATAIAQGNVPKGKSPEEVQSLRQQLRFSQNQEFLQLLDAQEPGLASKVVNWWQEKGGDYINRISGVLTDSGDGSFQSNNFSATAGGVIADRFADYAMSLSQADSAYQGQLIQRNVDLLTYGNDPTKNQVAALSHDKNLTDTERQQVYKEVIGPLLQTAKERGLDFNQTNTFIEQNINSFEPKTPEMKSLMKTLRRDRADVLSSMKKWRDITGYLYSSGLPGLSTAAAVDYFTSPDTNWYKQMSRGSTPPPLRIDTGKYRLPQIDLGITR